MFGLTEIAKELKAIAKALWSIVQELGMISRELRALRVLALELSEIEQDLDPKLEKGKVILMPKTINVGETANATLALVGTDGNPFTIDSTYTVVYAASNPGNVSIATPNADGSDTLTGVATDPGDVIGATITRPDGSTLSLTTDTLTINSVTPPVTLASGAVVLS